MARPSDGGKGSDRRREDGDAYRRNHDGIDWSKKLNTPPAPRPQPQPQARWAWELHYHDE